MALYQEINNVPGLSGSSSYQKQKQLYERLGSPQGSYRGSYDQNIWLLNQIRSGAAQQAMQPKPSPKPQQPQQQTSSDIAQDIANNAGADEVFQGPVFSEVLPFYQAWGGMVPNVQQEARQMVDPFVNRELRETQEGMRNQMAQRGSGRFAAAQGRLGDAWAEAERRRKAQIQDWVNQRRQGFKTLFYDPSEQAYNRAIELGQDPGEIDIPMSYDEMQQRMGNSGDSTFQAQPVTGQDQQFTTQEQPYNQWQNILSN